MQSICLYPPPHAPDMHNHRSQVPACWSCLLVIPSQNDKKTNGRTLRLFIRLQFGD